MTSRLGGDTASRQTGLESTSPPGVNHPPLQLIGVVVEETRQAPPLSPDEDTAFKGLRNGFGYDQETCTVSDAATNNEGIEEFLSLRGGSCEEAERQKNSSIATDGTGGGCSDDGNDGNSGGGAVDGKEKYDDEPLLPSRRANKGENNNSSLSSNRRNQAGSASAFGTAATAATTTTSRDGGSIDIRNISGGSSNGGREKGGRGEGGGGRGPGGGGRKGGGGGGGASLFDMVMSRSSCSPSPAAAAGGAAIDFLNGDVSISSREGKGDGHHYNPPQQVAAGSRNKLFARQTAEGGKVGGRDAPSSSSSLSGMLHALKKTKGGERGEGEKGEGRYENGGKRDSLSREKDWMAINLEKLSSFRIPETRMGFPEGGAKEVWRRLYLERGLELL